MRNELLAILACPTCAGDLDLAVDSADGEELLEGVLTCGECGQRYPLTRGVPRMNRSMEGLENVARTFGFEWKAHHKGDLEPDTVFGRDPAEDWEYFLTATDVPEERIEGAVVLDAGCGSGALTRQIGEHGAKLTVGIDVNEAVDEAHAASRQADNVQIVQANIFALPFKDEAFDLVWSNGVIHHTPDAKGAHKSLSRVVKSGGSMYVWVYPKRFNPFRFVKDIFDFTRLSRLPEPILLRVAKVMSYPSMALLALWRGIRSLPGLRPRTAWGERTVRPRTLQEVELTWFDALSPEWDTRHTEDEVIGWFHQTGFDSVSALEEPKVGVRGVRR